MASVLAISFLMCGSFHSDRSWYVEIGGEFLNTYLLFCFGWIEKKEKLLWKFCNEITQPFLAFESAPKCISQQH